MTEESVNDSVDQVSGAHHAMMTRRMMFCEIVASICLTGFPKELNFFLSNAIFEPVVSQVLDRRGLMRRVAIPCDVLLSVIRGEPSFG